MCVIQFNKEQSSVLSRSLNDLSRLKKITYPGFAFAASSSTNIFSLTGNQYQITQVKEAGCA